MWVWDTARRLGIRLAIAWFCHMKRLYAAPGYPAAAAAAAPGYAAPGAWRGGGGAVALPALPLPGEARRDRRASLPSAPRPALLALCPILAGNSADGYKRG